MSDCRCRPGSRYTTHSRSGSASGSLGRPAHSTEKIAPSRAPVDGYCGTPSRVATSRASAPELSGTQKPRNAKPSANVVNRAARPTPRSLPGQPSISPELSALKALPSCSMASRVPWRRVAHGYQPALGRSLRGSRKQAARQRYAHLQSDPNRGRDGSPASLRHPARMDGAAGSSRCAQCHHGSYGKGPDP